MEQCKQCKCQEKHDYAKLQPVLEEYAQVPGSLITILQHAQEIYGYLPTDVLWYISERTGIKPAKVLGVATFYTQFRFQPVGKYLMLLCNGTACHVNGAKKIEEVITEELIAYARLMQEKKLLVSGPQDPSLREIEVIK